jgi:hypothetical protein
LVTSNKRPAQTIRSQAQIVWRKSRSAREHERREWIDGVALAADVQGDLN